MARLGVQPSFLMNHVYFYGAAYRDELFGPQRAARMDPARDCVRLGLPFTIHTDAPCSNIGTLQLVQTAVTRKCAIDGSVVGPEQAVSLTDALRAVTIHAAGQIGMADQLGTLEFGQARRPDDPREGPLRGRPRHAHGHKGERNLGRRAEDVRMETHSKNTTCRTPIPSRNRSNPSLISLSVSRWVSSASTGSLPA